MDGTLAVLRRSSIAASRGDWTRRRKRKAVAFAAVLACLLIPAASAAPAAAETTTYSATQTIPVPPASNFAGSGGGDGWAVALSENAVYNVFHHESYIGVACHLQSNAEACAGWPKTVEEPGGSGFTSQPQPGLYLDQSTGKLYVFATRLSDQTGGVVCVDTTSEAANPFCGFTELTGKGEAPFTTNRGISGLSNPMLIGSHLYSFNFAEGPQSGDKNELTCFDVSTHGPCAGQPYAVTIPSGNVTTLGNEPIGETAAIGGKAIIPLEVDGESWIACFDDASQTSCGGQWPVKVGFAYVSRYGAPFPLLTTNGTTTGLCLPTGTDPCFNLQGESVSTPEHMTEAIPGTEEWNGPGLVLGPRVYVPNGEEDEVDCFDYSTGKSCANFPKQMENLGLLYTVNADPQRPSCIWVNADDGSAQIQDFDAYTGKECGEGTIRALASQFVVPQPQCTPASYVSLQVLRPGRETYNSGSVAFADGDGNLIPGLEERQLDSTGTASLAGLELNTPTGLPQFLITLNGAGKVGSLDIKLTWLADYNASCIGPHTTATAPAPATQPATTAVLAAKTTTPAKGTASIASIRGCIARTSYLASVHGTSIASVTFKVDGHTIKVLHKPTGKNTYSARVAIRSGSTHHVTIKVVFTSSSKTATKTLHQTVARCAARRSLPRFTG